MSLVETEGQSTQQQLLDESPNGVIFVDPDWRIRYANGQAAHLAQKTPGEMMNSPLWSVLPQFADPESDHACRQAMHERVPVQFEIEMLDGGWIDIRVKPHQDGIALYCQNVTRYKGAERELQEREAELRDFFENGNIAMHWVGSDGTILWANNTELNLLGYGPEEYIGRNIRDFHIDGPVIEDILCRLKCNEELHNYESRLRCKDGSVRYVAINSSVYRRGRQFVHTRCFTRDLTAEKSTMEVRERMAAIVESSDDAIISKDLNGIIQSWNSGAERLFGYKAEEIIGKHISTLAAPDRVDEIPNILEHIARGDRLSHYQTKRRTKDGRILSISLTVSPVRDATGRIIGASKVARDITEQVRSQEALRIANEALHQSNADLEQFAHSASHDLQEPLRMVTAYSELLQRKLAGKLETQEKEYIGFVVDGATRMEHLLQALRNFMQVSTIHQEPLREADPNVVVQRSLANLKASVDATGAVVRWSPLPLVRIPEVHLEQLFQNLISNAIRYRSEAPPEIQIAAERSGDAWKFSVQDNGIGIDPQYKEQIFGIFKRLHTPSEYPGTGMGLAICQRVVERVGGRIWVESQLGRGSTFYFTVPSGRDRRS